MVRLIVVWKLLLAIVLFVAGILCALFSPHPYDGVWLVGLALVLTGALVLGSSWRPLK